MLINWFTVVAQIVNFLILVALLKIFLYDRIIAAMDRREQRIQSRLETAEEKRAEAERERRTYEGRRREMEAKRDEMLKSAREEAEEKREALIGAAREEAEALQKRWRESLEADQEAFLRELREQAGRGFTRPPAGPSRTWPGPMSMPRPWTSFSIGSTGSTTTSARGWQNRRRPKAGSGSGPAFPSVTPSGIGLRGPSGPFSGTRPKAWIWISRPTPT